jgi:hypothetical protein
MYLKLTSMQSLGNSALKCSEMKSLVTRCCIIQTTQLFTPYRAILKQDLDVVSTFGPEQTTRSNKGTNLLHILGWQLNNELNICVID